jgi:histidinol dehydrogenase|tara:strand:- start:95 stop:1405 length:1311 start_codon:yes stop_codon:yes gene_type:complete
MLKIKKINSDDNNFSTNLQEHISKRKINTSGIREKVRAIISEVKQKGDIALIKYSREYDNYDVRSASELEITKEECLEALKKISKKELDALKFAKSRIQEFSEHQKAKPWEYTSEGITLGEKVTAIDKVGIYVPGGSAAYPSSVLMNSIPASVAGVKEIIMVVPSPKEEVNNIVLAAASLGGVDRIFRLGGAHSIAALAFGTDTIPKVNMIVGPGSQYVAEAKKELYGEVGIDSFAGPSEILIIADSSANEEWIALDLFSQAEHDELAQSILISPDANLLKRVEKVMQDKLNNQKRKNIIESSLNNFGLMVKVKNIENAIKISNEIAPEHLQLSIKNSNEYLNKIENAGAIFLGEYTPEVFGDYCAGSNHVLPTVGTAKFSSPLGVYDFQKRSNIIQCSKESAILLAKHATVLANAEGLFSHKDSASLRNNKGKME